MRSLPRQSDMNVRPGSMARQSDLTIPAAASYGLWVTIPRTEEVHDTQHTHFVKGGGARTVFVLAVHCKGALTSPGVGAGSTQTWQLKKRYGYFERVQRVAAKCAAVSGEAPPALPRRKLVGHRDPKYLQALREDLQLYLERVIELMQRAHPGLSLSDVLQQLELPVASDSATWEQRSKFGISAEGRSLPVEIEGQLRKQGGSKSGEKRGWKERWFVLTGSSLHYYTHPEAPATKVTGRAA